LANKAFDSLQDDVNQVKQVMTNNIDKILQRGDALDDLVDKTAVLENSVILILQTLAYGISFC
jgi:hypothetical protein